MRRRRTKLEAARQWLLRARSNLIRAKQPKPEGVVWEDLCFDAQQSVEKALKAVHVSKGLSFRKVHDIGELLASLSSAGIVPPQDVFDSVELTEFAVEARYPGPYEPVGEGEWEGAVRVAEVVVAWAESEVLGKKRAKPLFQDK